MNHCWHVLPCSTFHNIIFLQHEHNEFLYPVRRSHTATPRGGWRGEDRNCCHAPWRCPVWTGSGDTRGHVTRDNTSQLPPGQWLVNQWCHCRESVLSYLARTSACLRSIMNIESGDTNIKSHSSTRTRSTITYHMLHVCVVCLLCNVSTK